LQQMLGATRGALGACTERRGCRLEEATVWRIEPISFNPGLVSLARQACEAVIGSAFELPSGALHDAAEIAGRLPAAMLFCRSAGGVSHSAEEDTDAEALRAAIDAFGRLVELCLES